MQTELRRSYGSDCLLACDIEAQEKHIILTRNRYKQIDQFLLENKKMNNVRQNEIELSRVICNNGMAYY
jgi:hypothetical protein